jgi:hypothetical protein
VVPPGAPSGPCTPHRGRPAGHGVRRPRALRLLLVMFHLLLSRKSNKMQPHVTGPSCSGNPGAEYISLHPIGPDYKSLPESHSAAIERVYWQIVLIFNNIRAGLPPALVNIDHNPRTNSGGRPFEAASLGPLHRSYGPPLPAVWGGHTGGGGWHSEAIKGAIFAVLVPISPSSFIKQSLLPVKLF